MTFSSYLLSTTQQFRQVFIGIWTSNVPKPAPTKKHNDRIVYDLIISIAEVIDVTDLPTVFNDRNI
jgi:hypothetical protein